ncbi:hypothetical protein [Nocardioides ferulae]|uniref:hypothetical protein n=1 Tax=Nocardioides ferulae TaxID=2340821 RepID=UPI000EB19B3D|nr:hypothetical protein [Nocardioides ferulae]
MSTHHDETTATETGAETTPSSADRPRGWRRLALRGRRAIAAGIVAGSLAIGGLGFGAGYAVADRDAGQADPTQQTPPFDRFGAPGERGGPMGGQMDGQGEDDGSSGQAPDYDGDGQPDDTGSETGESSAQQG